MTPPSVIRVLVVQRQALVRAGLVALIRQAAGLVVAGEAASGEEAVTLALRSRPDVVLVEAGAAAAERLLAAWPGTPPRVLLLTASDEGDDVHAALRAGAAGFLLKESPPERLIASIHAVASGEAPAGRFTTPSGCAGGCPLSVTALTKREREVLRLVAAGMTNHEIASRLVVSEATVKTHLNRTLSKLRITTRAQAVVVAYESGLVTPRRALEAS